MHEVLVLVPRVERSNERLEVVPVPEEHMREARAEGQVRGDEVQRVRTREPRRLYTIAI